MDFRSSFLAHFTPQEQQSELVKLIAQQGELADIAISQEWTSRVVASTEFILFPESQIRSWLSFLLLDVPFYVAASGLMTVTHISGSSVSVPAGSVVDTAAGVPYITLDSLYIQPGGTAQVRIRQGETSVHSGTYNEFISIPSTDCDISNLTVSVGGSQVSKCRVVQDYITPYDGYHAYVFNDTLYIKIYSGTNTPDPEGLTYEVIVWECSGTGGNLGADQILGFQDTFKGIDGLPVELAFSNNEIVNGQDAPSRAKLVYLLRQWFFVKTTVSSIPEYTIWFLNQPEVGAVIVEGDFERYLRSLDGDLPITGKVYVAGLDPAGKPLQPNVQNTLLIRIQDVKDIGVISWEQPVEVKCYIDVDFVSSNSDSAFVSHVSNILENYFNLSWLMDNGMSSFDDLDFEAVRSSIGNVYSQTGMVIKPYHFYVDDDVSGTDWYIPESAIYVGESGVGKYLAYEPDPENPNEFLSTPYAEFEQYLDPDTDGSVIYCVKDTKNQIATPSYVGFRGADGKVEISGYPFISGSRVEAYWELSNPGYLNVGVTYGYRTLAGYKISQVPVTGN